MPSAGLNLPRLLAAGLIGAALVIAGTVVYLAQGLPQNPLEPLHFAATDFNFVMGSGTADADRVLIDGFTDGYALLSSGPVNIDADRYRFLRITIDRHGNEEIPTFFWRRSSAPEDLVRMFVREEGPALIDLSGEAKWQGGLVEFGFLLRGDGNGTLAIGPVRFEPDGLALRLQQTWDSWSAFERWTQKSVNFIWGGESRPLARLPVLIIAWVATALLLTWLISVLRGGACSRQLLLCGAAFLLAGWMVLDVRWTANNVRQIDRTMANWGMDEDQRLSRGMDGDIYGYVQQLKKDMLPDRPSRILIVGGEGMADYLLQRAKYHLLPHSAFVVRQFSGGSIPGNFDYLIYLGAPGSISRVPGWPSKLQNSLTRLDGSAWGEIYQVIPRP